MILTTSSRRKLRRSREKALSEVMEGTGTVVSKPAEKTAEGTRTAVSEEQEKEKEKDKE